MFNLAGAIRSMFIQGLISLLDAHSGQIVFALCSAVSEQFMDFSVGGIRHQSPDFGIVGTATYKLKRGEEYDVRLIHMDSQAAQPDDDYQARISTAGNSYVIGPDLLLGVFQPQNKRPSEFDSVHTSAQLATVAVRILSLLSSYAVPPERCGWLVELACFRSCTLRKF